MKKLIKPHKYNESNVEFYSNEIRPVSSPAYTNGNPYGGNSGGAGGGYSGAGGKQPNTNSNSGPSFATILQQEMNKLKPKKN